MPDLALIRDGDLTDLGVFFAGMLSIAVFLTAIGAGA